MHILFPHTLPVNDSRSHAYVSISRGSRRIPLTLPEKLSNKRGGSFQADDADGTQFGEGRGGGGAPSDGGGGGAGVLCTPMILARV